MSETSTSRRPGRGLRIALVLSLALNFLIVGAVVGFVAVGKDRREGMSPGLRALGLGPILPALSMEDRRALFERIRDNRDRLAVESRPFGRSIQAFTQTLRAEPFDRAAAEAALRAQRDHGAALQAEGHALLLDQLEAMTPEARAELAGRIETALRRSVERRGDGR